MTFLTYIFNSIVGATKFSIQCYCLVAWSQYQTSHPKMLHHIVQYWTVNFLLQDFWENFIITNLPSQSLKVMVLYLNISSVSDPIPPKSTNYSSSLFSRYSRTNYATGLFFYVSQAFGKIWLYPLQASFFALYRVKNDLWFNINTSIYFLPWRGKWTWFDKSVQER